MATSVFGALNRGLHRWPDTDVLFDDAFDAGFCGWRDHMGGSTPQAALGLTSHPVYSGSYALKLSTSRKRSTVNAAICSAYKNVSRFVDSGKVTYEVMLTVGGADLDEGPTNFALCIDTQLWDNSARGFYNLICRRFGGSTQTRVNEWAIISDDGTQIIFDSLATGAPMPGDNENKMNWGYYRLTIDLSANGGLGGYHEAQIGNRVYDLRSLGAGRGAQSPQTSSSVGAGSFAGGLNFGITMVNRNTVDVGPDWVVVDRARGVWSAS